MKTPLVVAALAAISCSPANVGGPISDAGAADTTADAASATTACVVRAYAYCSRLQMCSPTAVQLRFGDVRTCESLIDGECELAIATSSSGASAAQAESCAAAIPAWGCSDIIYTQNTPPACTVPTGPLANGAPCTINQQCQTGYCNRTPGAGCGVCGPVQQPGDPCSAGAGCVAPLACDLTTSSCTAFVEIGGSCDLSKLCDSGLTCVENVCQAGTTMMGGACNPLGAGCDLFSGLACNAQTSTCTTLTLVSAGGACGEVANQPTQCVTGACTHGVCAPYSGVGDACDIVAGPECATELRCLVTADGGTSGTCDLSGAGSCP